ncbi:hypothetical protein ABZ345_43080 [Lentzea sp. NPDC005914]|uniref:hypothetical protein n=1 Tax=Lentzea sp. NPDC005914 TaxID=3154572 RepID=UPI0033F61F1A
MTIVLTGGTALRRHLEFEDVGVDMRTRRRAFDAFNLAAEPVPPAPMIAERRNRPLVRTTRTHEDLEWWPEHDARAVLREVVTAMGRRA